MAEVLTREWVEALTQTAAVPAVGGDDVSLVCTVQGGPDGDVSLAVRYRSGTLSVTLENGEADVVATVPWNDAMAVFRGELRPTVAYMQGKLKPSGDMAQCLRLLKLSEHEQFAAVLAAVR